MLASRKLSRLLTFPTSFAGTEKSWSGIDGSCISCSETLVLTHTAQVSLCKWRREELWRQQMDFRKVHQQSLTEMEELRKFQSSTFHTIARRKLIEDQKTIFELSGRVQELQNEVNCMNDSKDFQDAESVRSGNSHVTSQPMLFPTHPIPEGMLRPSFASPRRKEGPPSIWDTHGISGNVFANPHASSSAPYPQELNPWRQPLRSRFICLQRRRVKDQNKIKI